MGVAQHVRKAALEGLREWLFEVFFVLKGKGGMLIIATGHASILMSSCFLRIGADSPSVFMLKHLNGHEWIKGPFRSFS